MYLLYAFECQRPAFLIRYFGHPALAALDAAPMRNEWAVYLPELFGGKASERNSLNLRAVMYVPFRYRKKGPGKGPRSEM